MVLDVAGADWNSGTNIQLYEKNGTNAQVFSLYHEGNNYGTPKMGKISIENAGNSVKLTIDRSPYTDKFVIYRSTDNSVFQQIAETSNNTYTDNSIDVNKTYYYKVKYVNRYYSPESSSVSINVTCNHKWTEWSISKAATCTSDGQQTRKCSTCGKTETQTISKTGHHYQETVIQPTYSEQGYTLHKCTGCGDSYKDKYVAKKRGYDPTKKPVASEVKKLQQLLTKAAKLAANEDLVDMFDANGDGKVNVIDALILKRRALK